jgi:hypothetical protein
MGTIDSINSFRYISGKGLKEQHKEKNEMFFETELPDDMKQVIEKWRKYVSAAGNENACSDTQNY